MSEYYSIPTPQWLKYSYSAKCYSTLRSISWWIVSSHNVLSDVWETIADRLSSGLLRDVNTKLLVLSICIIITLVPYKPLSTTQNVSKFVYTRIVSYVFVFFHRRVHVHSFSTRRLTSCISATMIEQNSTEFPSLLLTR